MKSYLIVCLGMLLSLVTLVGCGPSGSTSNNSSSVPGTVPATAAKESIQTADLSLAKLNQPLHLIRSNLVTLTSNTPPSVFRLQYKFNSANANAFKLLRLTRNELSNCSIAAPDQITLITKTAALPIVLDQLVKIAPSTDYVLQISHFVKDCAKLAISYDVTAWADHLQSAQTNPTYATVCEGQRNHHASFLSSTRFMNVFVAGQKQVFLSGDVFCGTRLARVNQKSCLAEGLSSDLTTVNCAVRVGSINRASQVIVNHKLQTAAVACSRNGRATYYDTFRACKEVVLDSSRF